MFCIAIGSWDVSSLFTTFFRECGVKVAFVVNERHPSIRCKILDGIFPKREARFSFSI